MMSETNPATQSRLRRCLRRGLRCGVVLAFVGMGLVLYLNQIGLPEFAKTMLQQELRANGLNLEFERLRWRFERGLVAEGIQLEVTRTNGQPSLVADELKLRFNRQALLTGNPKITSVLLSNGQFGLPLLGEQPLADLDFEVDDVQTKLSFPSPNLWLLDDFRATCLGIQFELQAEITNAFALKKWRRRPKESETSPQWPKILRQVMTIRDQVDFTGKPTLMIKLQADAARPERSTANLSLTCDAMESPWGSIEKFALQISTTEPDTPNATEFESSWTLAIGQLTRESSQLRSLQFSGNLIHESQSGRVKSAHWTLNTGQATHLPFGLESIQILGTTERDDPESPSFRSALEMVLTEASFPKGTLERIRLSSELSHEAFQWRQATGQWTAIAHNVQTPWASVKQSTLSGTVSPIATSTSQPNPLPSPWNAIQEFNLTLQLATENIGGATLQADSLSMVADWTAPTLNLQSIQGQLYDGKFDFEGQLRVDTRATKLNGEFDFDVHRIAHLLTPKGQRWLRQYQFERPPSVTVQAGVTLPAWDDPAPDWRGEVKPTMSINGGFTVGEAAFRTVPVQSASSSITFSNMTWRLPDLHVIRPEGELFLDYRCDANTQDYHWKIKTQVDYHALAPLLSPGQLKGLQLFEFSQPVRTDGEVWGRWYSPELTRLKTQISTTNFTFRGVPIESLKTDLRYVNGLVTANDVAIERAEGVIQATEARYNSHTQLITVTNAFASADATAMATMIGPNIERTFKSYRFSNPPKIKLNGVIPVDGLGEADAHFQVEGGPFAFWRFKVPYINAQVDWDGRQVQINDVDAPFYEGKLRGNMALKLTRGKGSEFILDAQVNDSNLNKLFIDVFSPESKSQGILNGHISIASGMTDDWDSWQGSGHVKLREGQLWDTPLFGIFSPLLNTVSPGLGNSRAGTGDAEFQITNSIIRTSDLVIQEPTTRLQYQGELDFQGNLDAVVEAELLRDTPIVGRVVSLALWPVSKLFVYKVSGNLREPVAEPVYVLPKILMNPIDSLINRKPN